MHLFLLLSAVFFHHGDFVPTYEFTHYPCAIHPIYISGLEENQVYAQNGDLFLYEDRIIYHLTPSQTQFDIKRISDDTIIDSVHIRWNTSCTKNQEIYTSKKVTSTLSSKATSAVITSAVMHTTEASSDTSKQQLQLYGIQKQTIMQYDLFNPLQGIYLYDQNGVDYSHILKHSPFNTDTIGTHYIEIKGQVGDQTISAIMEVDVIAGKQQRVEGNHTVFFTVVFAAITGGIILWVRK